MSRPFSLSLLTTAVGGAWLATGCGEGASADLSSCEPLTFELVGEWQRDELPQRASVTHTEPGVAVGDLDGDGWSDALVAYGGGSFLLRNDGTGTLALDDTLALAGEPLPAASAVSLADLDGDGDLDVWLGREWGATDLLLTNDGQLGFTAMELAGSEGPGESGTFGDLDGDGDLDLFIAQMYSDANPGLIIEGEQEGWPNLAFIQQDGAFVLDESRLPQAENRGMSFEGVLFDADGDGDLDIYVGNAWGMVLPPNQLLINDGSGVFTEADRLTSGAAIEINSMGVALGDADGDGDADLYITDIGSPTLLVGLGDGTFADATAAQGATIPPGPTNLSGWGTTFVDLDLDGCMDIYTAFGGLGPEAQDHLDYVQPEGETWTDPEVQADVLLLGSCGAGFTRAERTGLDDHLAERNRVVAVTDLDLDGRPDLVTAGKHYVRAWRTLGGCGDSVRVSLDGPGGNSEGHGARVRVKVGERTTTQWMSLTTTHSSSEAALWFGLGGAGQADEILVTWPDGTVSRREDVGAGEVVVHVGE